MADEKDLPAERMLFEHGLDRFIDFLQELGLDAEDDVKDVVYNVFEERGFSNEFLKDD